MAIPEEVRRHITASLNLTLSAITDHEQQLEWIDLYSKILSDRKERLLKIDPNF